jgi:DNA gyrase/topoisomerase IV subunit A
VIGIRVEDDDAVAGLAIAGPKDDLLITTSRGKSKQMKMKVFKSLGRATGGYRVQHVIKNELITGLIKAVERIATPEARETSAGEPVQMELAVEAPVKKKGST